MSKLTFDKVKRRMGRASAYRSGEGMKEEAGTTHALCAAVVAGEELAKAAAQFHQNFHSILMATTVADDWQELGKALAHYRTHVQG